MEQGSAYLTSRLRGAAKLAPFLSRAFGLTLSAAPEWTIVWLILLFVQGMLPALTVYLTRALVNSLVAAIEAGGTWAAVQPALLLAILMGLVLAAIEILRGVTNWVRTALSEKVQDLVGDQIHERAQTVDLLFYDLPEYYDNLYRASQEASYRPVALLENIGALLQSAITLVAMTLVLLPYGLWLPLVLLISTIPAVVIVLRNARRRYEYRRITTAQERHTWYYNWLLTSRESAAELRLFALGPVFRERFRQVRQFLRDSKLDLVKREGWAELAAGVVALLAVGATMLVLVSQALRGLLSLGDLALIYTAFTQGQSLLRIALQSVGQLFGNSLFISDLFAFLDLQPTINDPVTPLTPNDDHPEAIRFRGVTFNYPGSTRPALSNFDLLVPNGKTIAVVGANGAGKSTFVKLLCRFYDPTDGSVELLGQDLRHLRQEDIRARLSIQFQTPLQYNATAAENITLALSNGSADLETAKEAAIVAGADEVIQRLSRGYEAPLGIWFEDGTDLSVGEWRRIALARALVRKEAILVLDEPTSAMDPWAEAKWLTRFRDYARGRTVILITHRFTTARMADIIYVMENGAIVESGTHLELLANNGRYAQSWREAS